MKLVIGVVLYNLLSIFVFSLLYYYNSDGSINDLEREHGFEPITYLDVLFFSTTIQAGVGLSSIVAQTPIMKWLIILQQVLMISSYIFLVAFFKLK